MKPAILCSVLCLVGSGFCPAQSSTPPSVPALREKLAELRHETPTPEVSPMPEVPAERPAYFEKTRPIWTAYWEKEHPRLLALADVCARLLTADPRAADAAALEHEMADAYLSVVGSVGPSEKTAREHIDALLARPDLKADTAAQFYGYQMNMIAIISGGDSLNREIVPVTSDGTQIPDRIRQVIEKFAARYPGSPALGRLCLSGAECLLPRASFARGVDTAALREKWLQQAERCGDEETRREVATLRMRAASVGHDAPPVAFIALDGRKVDLADLKGKVVVIDFWATWCEPCVQAMPDVRALYERDHGRGLEIIGISLDSDRAKLEAFVRGHNLPWPQFFDGKGWENAFGEKFGVRSVPETWVIDPAGRVAAISADDLPGTVEALLPK